MRVHVSLCAAVDGVSSSSVGLINIWKKKDKFLSAFNNTHIDRVQMNLIIRHSTRVKRKIIEKSNYLLLHTRTGLGVRP